MILDFWPTRLRLVLMLVFSLQTSLAAAAGPRPADPGPPRPGLGECWSRICYDARTGAIGGVLDRGRLLPLEFLFGDTPFWSLEARVPEGHPWRRPGACGFPQTLEVRLVGRASCGSDGRPYCLVWSIEPAGPEDGLLAPLEDLDQALVAALEATEQEWGGAGLGPVLEVLRADPRARLALSRTAYRVVRHHLGWGEKRERSVGGPAALPCGPAS